MRPSAKVNALQKLESSDLDRYDLTGIDLELRIELARRYAKKKDILNWGRVLFPEKFNLPFCSELHGYFVRIRGMLFTVTEAPRNHAKTTIKCFLIPIFQALEEPETFRHYLNVQATQEKAIAVNIAIRSELENNLELRVIYGNQVNQARWADKQFVLNNGVIFTAVGAGQSIRGIQYKNIRPDYILVDDLYDEEDINNIERTQKKNKWFWGSLYLARAKSRRCSIHVQGTAINNADLLEKLKFDPRFKAKTFKSVTDWNRKKVLWRELNTFEDLKGDLESMGSVIFFRELQNERRDEESAIVKESWLTNWEYDPAELVFDEHFFIVDIIMGIDPSIGQTESSDYTGIIVAIKTGWDDGSGNDWWIDDIRNEHLSLDKRIKLVQQLADDRSPSLRITRANVEGIAGFKDFVAELKRRTNIPIREVSKVPDKITNLENKSHYFENGKVHVSKKIDQRLRDALKHQLITNHPPHDDIRDAALIVLDSPTQGDVNITVI